MAYHNPYGTEDPRESEREQSTPILNHIYSGRAWRLMPTAEETISGAFRVIDRGQHYATLGNGERPETRWMIFDLEYLERADQLPADRRAIPDWPTDRRDELEKGDQ